MALTTGIVVALVGVAAIIVGLLFVGFIASSAIGSLVLTLAGWGIIIVGIGVILLIVAYFVMKK